MNKRLRIYYFCLRFALLSSQFLFYKDVLTQASPSSVRVFVASSTLISLLGITDFGLGTSAQRIFATSEKSIVLLGSLFEPLRASLAIAALFSSMAGFLSFFIIPFYDFVSSGVAVILVALSVFILSVAYLFSSTLGRIAFSNLVHGYTASLAMSVGPLVSLILFKCRGALHLTFLSNPSYILFCSTAFSYSLCIVYTLYFFLRWNPLAAIRSLFGTFQCFGTKTNVKPVHDWMVGALGMLTLQADSITIIFLDPSGLASYFVAVKIISLFAFFSSLELPRIFSIVAEHGIGSIVYSSFSRYSILSKLLPLISLLCIVLYLGQIKLLSYSSVLSALLLSLALSLRIMTDLYSCVLQSLEMSRSLIIYLPFQAVLTVLFSVILGHLYGSVGVALAQFLGFGLVAYPWLRRLFCDKIYSLELIKQESS